MISLPDNQIYEGHDLDAMAKMPRYHEWIAEYFDPYLKGSGIEFGAGLGSISHLIQPKLKPFDLVEPSRPHAAYLANRFRTAQDITIHMESLESYTDKRAENSVNTVVLSNVLEHIENDELAVRGIYRLLNAGGHILIFVPALQFLFSELDTRLGHFRRYHRDGLISIVEAAGFRVQLVRYFDLLGVFPWWAIHTVIGKTNLDPKMSAIYDCIGVPVTRNIEKLFSPPFGKNIILVARK